MESKKDKDPEQPELAFSKFFRSYKNANKFGIVDFSGKKRLTSNSAKKKKLIAITCDERFDDVCEVPGKTNEGEGEGW